MPLDRKCTGALTFENVATAIFGVEQLAITAVHLFAPERTRLVVAATGTGKTVISAFDFKRFKKDNPSAKLLFLAHRKEILTQSIAIFRGILRDNNFGALWVDGLVPDSYENVFASVQTINNQLET